MIGHNIGMIVHVQYEEGVLDSSSPAVFTKIVRQDFLRLSIKLPDTVRIAREYEGSDTLTIRGVDGDELRAKITSFANAGALAAFKARGCRITHIRVSDENSTGRIENTSSTPKRPRMTRPLPAANHKAAGFAAYRSKTAKGPRPSSSSGTTLTAGTPIDKGLSSSQPMGLARSLTGKPSTKAPSPPRSFSRAGGNATTTRHDSDSHVHSPPFSVSASEPRGTKRKLDDSMDIDESPSHEDDDDGSEIVILGVSEPGDGTPSSMNGVDFDNLHTEPQATPEETNTGAVEAEPFFVANSEDGNRPETNKVRDLVRTALAKAVEGEKQRLVLEAHLRQEIAFLEGRLQQERADHNVSKQRILDLEEGLITATSNVERTNALIQATSAQLLRVSREDRGKLE